MKIRFYLHNTANAQGEHPIYMEVRWARHAAAQPGDPAAVRLSTGKTCKPSGWNTEKERPRKDHNATKRLNGLEGEATDVLDKAQALGTKVLAAEMKKALGDYVKYDGEPVPEPTPAPAEPEPTPTALTIPQLVAHWQRQSRGQRTPNYLRAFNSVATYWDSFRPGTLITEIVPAPGSQRSELVEQWISYLLQDIPRRGAPGEFGLDNNTVGSYIKRLRTLLQFAELPYAWLKDSFTYDVDIEPLEYEEVVQLAGAEMPRLQLERCRDVFVFDCFTGPRYANLRGLAPGDVRVVKGVPIMEYSQFKGRKKIKVKVALDPIAYEIWRRYKGQLPVQSNTQMNELIKEAAAIAGLNRPVSVVRQYGTEQVTLRGPLHEFITMHVGRHTFGTLLLDGGASIVEAQDGLGHSSLQSTRRYAKVREKQRHTSTLGAFEKLRTSHSAQ